MEIIFRLCIASIIVEYISLFYFGLASHFTLSDNLLPLSRDTGFVRQTFTYLNCFLLVSSLISVYSLAFSFIRQKQKSFKNRYENPDEKNQFSLLHLFNRLRSLKDLWQRKLFKYKLKCVFSLKFQKLLNFLCQLT